jgi:cytoskeleton protein RodZ
MANNCSDELRKARESQNISLEDLSIATRISVRFLKAIEDGNFSVLPQTYIRAFIRDYANEVGLNPDSIIKVYERVIAPFPAAPENTKSASVAVPPVKVRLPRRKGATQSAILIVTILILTGALVVAVLFVNKLPKNDVKEIPFQNVIEEREKSENFKRDTTRLIGPELPPKDSLYSYIAADSLVLVATATESAWISIVSDDKVRKEILLLPNKSAQWKAAMQFKITVGNAGSTIFKLNDKVVGAIGKRGAVIKDYILTRKYLENKP